MAESPAGLMDELFVSSFGDKGAADTKLFMCATDAGGMRNLLPILQVAEKRFGLAGLLVTSRNTRQLAKNRHWESLSCRNVDDLSKFLTDNKPDAVVCGTTRYLSAERVLTNAARKMGTRVLVVLDEWFNYRLRFENEDGTLNYLPDLICCQDDRAKQEAVSEGIPEGNIYVTGSPYLSTLAKEAQSYLAHPTKVPKAFKEKSDAFRILFLSETHEADYGSEPGKIGCLGPYLGYTEFTVRQNIYEVLESVGQPVEVVEKLHPAHDILPEPFPLKKNVTWYTVKEAPLWPLMWHSQLVIGMRSISLLEARLLGCQVISYQPNLIGNDCCTVTRLGLARRLSSASELHDFVRVFFNKPREKKSHRNFISYPFTDPNAAGNVLDLAIENLRRVI